jgi:HemY protein
MRMLIFLIQIIFVATATIWLSYHPGTVRLDWQNYHVETTFTVFTVGAVSFFLILYVLNRVWRFLVSFPSRVSAYVADKRQQKGLIALIEAQTALELGDSKSARAKVEIIRHCLESEVLSLSVLAQVALQEDDLKAAHNAFLQMNKYPLGHLKSLYGQIVISLKQKDFSKAYTDLQELVAIYPKACWVLKTLFEIGVSLKKYNDALELLRPMIRTGQLTDASAQHHQAVLFYEKIQEDSLTTWDLNAKISLLEKAHALAPDLIPIALTLIQTYKLHGCIRKGFKVIEKTWSFSPHPLLAVAYEELEPVTESQECVERLRRLASFMPHHIESELMIARAELKFGRWGQARGTLNRLGKNYGHTMASCRLMAELELAEKGDEISCRHWLEKALIAKSDPGWICTQCNRPQETWISTCKDCHTFDSIKWK